MNKKFETPCKYCIFAEYEGLTQTGCTFDRLDLFREKKISIIEAYDEEKEFFVIDQICNYYRHNKWKYHDAEKKVQREQIQREIAIKYKGIVIASDNIEDAEITVNSLLNQYLPPEMINVIIPKVTDNYKVILDMMRKCNIPWKVHNITTSDISRHKAIDIAVINKPSRFHAVFNAGISVPLDTFSTINHAINEELERIVLIKPNDNGDGLIVLHNLYMSAKDFRSLGSLYNFQEILPKCPSITEICPKFPK